MTYKSENLAKELFVCFTGVEFGSAQSVCTVVSWQNGGRSWWSNMGVKIPRDSVVYLGVDHRFVGVGEA
jgi:hypothetical protein